MKHSTRESKLHTGHRQRVKDKVRKNGIKSLSTHEVLETLLFFGVPFKDTNETAHRLLDKYGSIQNVLATPESELKKFEGIGENAAFMISFLNQFYEEYFKHANYKTPKLPTADTIVDYFRANIKFEDFETSYLCFTNQQNYLVKWIKLSEGLVYQTTVKLRDLNREIGSTDAKNLMLIHTHPHGSPLPSDADINATKQIMMTANLLGVNFKDHIIISSSEFYSFRSDDRFSDMELDASNTINNVFINKNTSNGK